MNTVVFTPNAPRPIGPYSQAVLVDNTLYISGQIPLDPSTNKVVGELVEEQTHQVMKNIKAILTEANFQLEDVVKCSIFITNMGDFPIINKVYGSYFSANFPARETVQVAQLPLGVQVEISAIACR